jgi:ATP-dependent Zn protease
LLIIFFSFEKLQIKKIQSVNSQTGTTTIIVNTISPNNPLARTNKQRTKLKNKQKQTNKRTNKQTSIQANKNKQTNKQKKEIVHLLSQVFNIIFFIEIGCFNRKY